MLCVIFSNKKPQTSLVVMSQPDKAGTEPSKLNQVNCSRKRMKVKFSGAMPPVSLHGVDDYQLTYDNLKEVIKLNLKKGLDGTWYI